MIEPNLNVKGVSTHQGKDAAVGHFSDSSPASVPSMENEVKRRWPGIVVLAHRMLGDELGLAVYFTFPGGKYMAVWMSGINEVCVVSEDQPCWRLFTAKNGANSRSRKSAVN